MAKKQTAESDEARLKKKIGQKLANHSNPEGDAAVRSLRKRLKREQRRRRAMVRCDGLDLHLCWLCDGRHCHRRVAAGRDYGRHGRNWFNLARGERFLRTDKNVFTVKGEPS